MPAPRATALMETRTTGRYEKKKTNSFRYLFLFISYVLNAVLENWFSDRKFVLGPYLLHCATLANANLNNL